MLTKHILNLYLIFSRRPFAFIAILPQIKCDHLGFQMFGLESPITLESIIRLPGWRVIREMKDKLSTVQVDHGLCTLPDLHSFRVFLNSYIYIYYHFKDLVEKESLQFLVKLTNHCWTRTYCQFSNIFTLSKWYLKESRTLILNYSKVRQCSIVILFLYQEATKCVLKIG